MLLRSPIAQVIHLILLIVVLCSNGYAQEGVPKPEPIGNDTITGDTITLSGDDSSLVAPDSLNAKNDSVIAPSPQKKPALESKVDYKAADSLAFDLVNQKVYLYGNAQVNYETVTLNAAYIEIDLKNKNLFAKGVPDSTGTMVGSPVFKDGPQTFTTDSMQYNFKTKQGIIYQVITQEGDGYLHGNKVKKLDDDVLYIKGGKYTTCSNEDPHYHLQANKLKVIKNNKIVTGPAYMVVEKIPTPLAIPFGFFPNKKGQSSGILIPAYGQSPNLGFFLTNGGYYFGFSDYADLTLTGDIYSRGSWAGNMQTNYKKRYKYNGNFRASYSVIKQGDEEFPDFSKNTNFNVKWRHTQDPKARPNSNFSADVNAGSVNNFRNNFNTSTNDYLSNTFQSNISYTKRWPGKPFNWTVSASHNQSTRDSIINITIPNSAFSVNRFYPFKRKNRVGAEKLYEKIGITYRNTLRNAVSAKEDSLFSQKTLRNARNGMQHNATANMNIKARKSFLKYFNITPSVTYTDVWYLQTIERTWDEEQQKVVTDTLGGFSRFGQVGLNTGVSTIIYGMYNFGKVLKAVRHVVTPSVNFSWRPDYADERFGYYKTVQSDTNGNTSTYSVFGNGIFGSPSRNESGVVGFNIMNNLEMKVRNRADSTGADKKIKIFESFNVASSYNIAIDSLNWAPINITARTKLLENVNLQASSTLDPYAIDSVGRKINTFQWDKNQQVGRFTNARVAINFSLKSKRSNSNDQKNSEYGTEEELQYINANPDGFVDFNVPWSINVGYNITYSKPAFTENITNAITLRGDINLTPKWKIGYNTGYDFRAEEITYSSFEVYRDLHCWEFSFNLIPFGQRQSYTFDLNVKAPVLQDLKLSRKRNWYDL